MKVCITTTDRNTGDYIYDLLTDPLSGTGCLSGAKVCIDPHNMVPDIMEFQLSQEEVDAVRKLDNVVSVNRTDLTTISLAYVKERQPDAIYRNASWAACGNLSTTQYPKTAPTGNLAPVGLYYATNYKPDYNQTAPANNLLTSYSVDCSNVDILVIDTGVDPSCEDLKDNLGNNLVQLFDWGQLVDPFTGVYDAGTNNTTYSAILPEFGYAGMPGNYYVDFDGHGTKCASLIAGLKCGLAKNARIYTLNVSELGAAFGFSMACCMRLAVGFVFAKQNNLFGLSSGRPTVCSNSWNVNGPYISGFAGPFLDTNIRWLYQGPSGVPSGKTKPISPISVAYDSYVSTGSPTPNGNNNDGLLAGSFDLGSTRGRITSTNGSTGVVTYFDFYDSLPFYNLNYYTNTTNNQGNIYSRQLPGQNDVYDAYFRVLLANGIHCVVAAGNSNLELNYKAPTLLPMLTFLRSDGTSSGTVFNNTLWSVFRQKVIDSATGNYVDNATGLSLGSVYTIADSYNTTTYTLCSIGNASNTINLSYSSPDIGAGIDSSTGTNWSRTTYPIIKVGCVTALGTLETNPNQTYDTGGYCRSIYNVINGIQWYTTVAGVANCFIYNNTSYAPFTSDGSAGVLFNNGTNNLNLKYGWSGLTFNGTSYLGSFTKPFYVKSPYSNFGPDVDIYAEASAVWSGFSNTTYNYSTNKFKTITGEMSGADQEPFFVDQSSTYGAIYKGKYIFHNGTSAATPLVAGALATYLASNPTASPLTAKNWLVASSVKGEIMTTNRTPNPVTASGTDATRGSYGVTTDGTTLTSIKLPSWGISHTLGYGGTVNGNNIAFDVSRTSTVVDNWVAAPAFTLRNANTTQALSGSYDIYNKTGNNSIYMTQIWDVLFGCRFFNDSNNCVVQAYPLRKAVFTATTGTKYASAIYLDSSNATKFGSKLQITSTTETYTTHQPSEYIISP
jgi:hypothetical protein